MRPKLATAYAFLRAGPKTILFNLRYLPLRDALRLPILVSHRVVLSHMGGRVQIRDPVRFGMVRVGFGKIEIFDRARSRTIWYVDGDVTFCGQAQINHGCRLEVKGSLELGRNVRLMAENQIVCHRRIVIEDDTLISWDVLLMDTDHHAMLDADGRPRELTGEIVVGSGAWIGSRVTVLKGVTLGPGSVVAANTSLHRSFPQPRVLIGGNPPRILRENVRWKP